MIIGNLEILICLIIKLCYFAFLIVILIFTFYAFHYFPTITVNSPF